MENESNKKKSSLSKAKNTTKKYSRRVSDNTMFSDNDYVHEQLDRLTYAMEAFKAGDISVRLSKERNDKFADLAEAYNSMVEMIGGIGTEVSRISKVSGIEGNLDAQIVHKEEEGVWKDLIDDTNTLIKSIHKPVQEVSRIANNIAKGIIDEKYDLTSVSGDFRSMAESINRSLGNLTIFSKQVIQLAHEVGIEGKLGGQASVHNVSGVWLNITSNINLMSDNLTQQVREIVGLTNLVVNGDLSKRISEEGKGGEVLELTHTINEMVYSLNIFSSEVIRVAKEVGTEGILGGQANVPDVSGIWKDLTEGVNLMAFNLTSQVREIAEVAKAVANGNLNKKIAIIVQGEVKDLKYTINGMVDSLIVFSSEVGRVTREVGTEGWLGGQALVPGVTGTWAELTNNVNIMASNITSQVREIATVATAVANGDLGQKIAEEGKGGEILDLSLTINNMVDSLNIFSEQISKVVRDVGIEGKLGGEAKVPNLAGTWFDITSHINMMSGNLTQQVREISQVATAVVKGDLSHKITINAKGEIAELKSTINEMVDSLNIFSGEVIRVASEVGIEGKLGGKARIPNVAGTWKTLLDSVNIMTSNLTLQVRQIAYVTQAILNGDLSQKITITADGEIAELKNTINEMVDFLSVLASGVTNVSKEVGVEGILGGQALVPGAIGAWKKLTDTVNLMASNLTFQVRNIAGVSTALAQGDFSKKINVEVRGEVKELKSNINSMVDSFNTLVESTNAIANGNFSVEMPLRGENDQLSTALNSMTNSLRSISNENEMEAWIKTGQSELNDSMRGEQDLPTLSKIIISYLTKYLDAQVGVFYIKTQTENHEKLLVQSGSYAFTQRKTLSTQFKYGEGLVGQAALEKEPILLTKAPKDYISVNSALGEKIPENIIIHPFLLEGEVKGVIEIGAFHSFSKNQLELLALVSDSIGIAINSSQDREKMQILLDDSQRHSEELLEQQEKLKTQSEELQSTNEELEIKTKDLEKQKEDIQHSRYEIEHKAKELELASKYKSEFLANMSHELRTPLNSLLILSKELYKNERLNLHEDQVKDAKIIFEGGQDLLSLINDILDLSKVEAGKMQVQIDRIKIDSILKNLENQFVPVANGKKLTFDLLTDENVPAIINTDNQRLEQIIKNLLSNAFKFTESGGVTLRVHLPEKSIKFRSESLNKGNVVSFSVTDTGVGIPEEKQLMIFDAFQQEEGGTSRQYGGTGLGLTISRELAKLLGGELYLESEVEKGSTFTICIPVDVVSPALVEEELYESKLKIESKVPYPQTIITESKRVYIEDDRDEISNGDSSILIIEDDKRFAGIIKKEVQKSNYKVLITPDGKEGLELASTYQPVGIILDLKLPDINGFKVLDNLKFDLNTRHIPVHIISVDDTNIKSLQKGAIGFLCKPASKIEILNVISKLENMHKNSMKEILVVEDNKSRQQTIIKLLKNDDINITAVESGEEAINKINKEKFDCIILDLKLPDISGFEVLKRLKEENKMEQIPVIIYTGKELSRVEVRELNQYTESIVVKGVFSPERLLDEVSMFLHSVESNLSAQQRKIMTKLLDPDTIFQNRKILLVDDDMRNTYALFKILTDVGMEVIMADNGEMALDQLTKNKEISLIIMDIMMPVMDGYTAIAKIRKMELYKSIPIIALTAKAMAEDKAKCLDVGADDYLTKPVKVDKLLNMMRVWLYDRN